MIPEGNPEDHAMMMRCIMTGEMLAAERAPMRLAAVAIHALRVGLRVVTAGAAVGVLHEEVVNVQRAIGVRVFHEVGVLRDVRPVAVHLPGDIDVFHRVLLAVRAVLGPNAGRAHAGGVVRERCQAEGLNEITGAEHVIQLVGECRVHPAGAVSLVAEVSPVPPVWPIEANAFYVSTSSYAESCVPSVAVSPIKASVFFVRNQPEEFRKE